MAKIKSVSSYNGTNWGTPVPLGANDLNIDITSSTTNPSDNTSTIDGLIQTDVTVSSSYGDTDATAWTKFNKFRKRVYNNFNNTIRTVGGTVTGDLLIKGTTFPANTTETPALQFRSSNDITWGSLIGYRNEGSTRGGLMIEGGYNGISSASNALGLFTDAADGAPFIYFNHPEAWRTAIAGSPFAVAYGGTGGSSTTAALGSLGTLDFKTQGTVLSEGTNIDTQLTPGVTYYTQVAADTKKLNGTLPADNSGLKIIQLCPYSGSTQYAFQFCFMANDAIYYRRKTGAGNTSADWGAWHSFVGTTNPIEITGISNIISCSSPFAATQAYCYRWGRVVMLRITIKRTDATTVMNSMTDPIGTLKANIPKPITNTLACFPSAQITGGYLDTSGNIYATGQMNKDSGYTVFSTYITGSSDII